MTENAAPTVTSATMASTRDESSVIGLLKSLHEARRSGVLRVSRPETTTQVYFRDGAIVFARSDESAQRLGERLVRAGALKKDDLELACRVRDTSPLRLGKTLVDLGYVTSEQIDDQVKEQVTTIVCALFPWETGSYRTEIGEGAVEIDLERDDLSTENILMEGVRRVVDPSILRQGLGALDGPVAYAFDLARLPPGVALTPAEGFVLSRVDGATTASEIATLSPLGEEETLRCIYALVAAGLLKTQADAESPPPAPREPLRPELSPEALRFATEMQAKHAALSEATLYQILDVPPNAKLEAIKSAYFRLAKQLHPDHLAGLRVADPDGVYGALYFKVKNAYEVLSNEAERRRYDFGLEQAAARPPAAAPGAGEEKRKEEPSRTFSPDEMARIHFGNGERALSEHRYHDAVEELRAAIRHDPARAEYHRLLGRALAKNPKWRKQAEEHLWKALELNRFDSHSYLELGELYEESGLSTRARKMFEEAIAIDPDNLRARERLEQGKSDSSTLGRLKGLLDRSKGH
jgi:curved DNA-binding protein CbpA